MKLRHLIFLTTSLCFANASVQALPTIVADKEPANRFENEYELDGVEPYEGLSASSTLAPQCSGKCTYYIQNLADGDESTSWVEGKRGYGIGQSI